MIRVSELQWRVRTRSLTRHLSQAGQDNQTAKHQFQKALKDFEVLRRWKRKKSRRLSLAHARKLCRINKAMESWDKIKVDPNMDLLMDRPRAIMQKLAATFLCVGTFALALGLVAKTLKNICHDNGGEHSTTNHHLMSKVMFKYDFTLKSRKSNVITSRSTLDVNCK